MENDESVDGIIRFVADALEKNVDMASIQSVISNAKLPENIEPELVLIAGRILYEHRRAAPPKKTLIKRVS